MNKKIPNTRTQLKLLSHKGTKLINNQNKVGHKIINFYYNKQRRYQ